jgi:O-antigen/teichoic acid export membrane protein
MPVCLPTRLTESILRPPTLKGCRRNAKLMSHSPFSGAKFRKAIRYFVVGRAAQAVATLAVTLLAVRFLAPAPYGIYMILWGLVELGSPLTSLGLLPAVQRFLPELAERGTPERLGRFVSSMLIARFGLILIGSGVVIAFWPALSAWMGHFNAQPVIGWLGGAMLACVLASRFNAEMLECLLEQRYAQTVRALLPLLRVLGLATLWLTGTVSLAAMLCVDLVAAAVAVALGEWWLAWSLRRLRPAGDFVVDKKHLIRFIWHMSGTQMLNAVASVGTLRLIVARLLGLELAGQFAFMQQLIAIAHRYLPSVLLANLIRPMLIARHAAGQARDVATGFGFLWKVNVALIWPWVPLMLLCGDPLILLLSGGRVPNAGLPMSFLIVGLIAAAQNHVTLMALQVYRYTGLALSISTLALLAPLLVLLGAHHGLPWAALGIALALGTRGLWGTFVLQRQPLHMQLDFRGALRLVIALVVASSLAWASYRSLGPLVATILLVTSYIVLTRFAKPICPEEMTIIDRAVGRRFRWIRGWSRAK